MAPVMSSVTVACCVKSPSATVCSSFINRKMAAWLASLTRLASCSWRSASSRWFSASDARWAWSRTYSFRKPAPPSAITTADSTSIASATLLKPVSWPSFSCTISRPLRSGSLSAMIAVCASRADTRPCRLPRIAPACVRVSSYCLSSATRRSLVCGSFVGGRRSSWLPSDRPWAISRNEFKSLPSRNTASGLTPSIVRNSLADLPMRCVNITSWPTADSSAGDASCCSFSDEIVSAVSSRSDDWRLIARSAWPTCVRIFCCAMTVLAFFSARSTSGSNGSMASCTPAGAADRSPSPVFRPRTFFASTSLLSRTSGKACGLPIKACDTDFASRCDCISA